MTEYTKVPANYNVPLGVHITGSSRPERARATEDFSNNFAAGLADIGYNPDGRPVDHPLRAADELTEMYAFMRAGGLKGAEATAAASSYVAKTAPKAQHGWETPRQPYAAPSAANTSEPPAPRDFSWAKRHADGPATPQFITSGHGRGGGD